VNLCILLEWVWAGKLFEMGIRIYVHCSKWVDKLLEMGPPVGVFLIQLEGLGEVGLLRHAAARACGQRQVYKDSSNRRKDSLNGKDS
jgi:hypothetical protein